MSLNLMILTSYFAMKSESIRGGIGCRYVGLYGSLVKALLKYSPESKVFWYSHTDESLRLITRRKTLKSRSSMLKAVLGSISTTFKNRSYLVVILAYPYAIPRVQAILEYILSLLVLKALSLGRIKVVVDDFDPPVEATYAFEVQPSVLVIACKRILDMLTLKLASFVVTVSESFKHHIGRLYHIEERRMFVVSNGSLVRYINSNPSMSEGYLRILYSGSAMKSKDVDKLIFAVGELKKKSYNILLVLTGSKSMDIPTSEWIVHKKVDNWISYVKNFLETSDICVIPYPHSLFWDYTTLAKLFDYMAAGKAVISTDLNETGKIIRMFNCGLVARSWKEFELCLERLYQDRDLTRKLGENGRRAAQKYFDYELLAEAFLEKLLDMFKGARYALVRMSSSVDSG